MSKCSQCFKPFGFFLKEDSCKKCGKFCCKNCLKHEVDLAPSTPPTPAKKGRVCAPCYHSMTESQNKHASPSSLHEIHSSSNSHQQKPQPTNELMTPSPALSLHHPNKNDKPNSSTIPLYPHPPPSSYSSSGVPRTDVLFEDSHSPIPRFLLNKMKLQQPPPSHPPQQDGESPHPNHIDTSSSSHPPQVSSSPPKILHQALDLPHPPPPRVALSPTDPPVYPHPPPSVLDDHLPHHPVAFPSLPTNKIDHEPPKDDPSVGPQQDTAPADPSEEDLFARLNRLKQASPPPQPASPPEGSLSDRLRNLNPHRNATEDDIHKKFEQVTGRKITTTARASGSKFIIDPENEATWSNVSDLETYDDDSDMGLYTDAEINNYLKKVEQDMAHKKLQGHNPSSNRGDLDSKQHDIPTIACNGSTTEKSEGPDLPEEDLELDDLGDLEGDDQGLASSIKNQLDEALKAAHAEHLRQDQGTSGPKQTEQDDTAPTTSDIEHTISDAELAIKHVQQKIHNVNEVDFDNPEGEFKSGPITADGEDDEAARIVNQFVLEAELDAKVRKEGVILLPTPPSKIPLDEDESKKHKKPRPPNKTTRIMSYLTPHQADPEEDKPPSHQELEDKWCSICCEDADYECVDCEGDLYCKKCIRGHDDSEGFRHHFKLISKS